MKKNPASKAVWIERSNSTLFVRFVSRSKGKRYFAAQFYAGDGGATLGEVEAWVNAQPGLMLRYPVNGPKGVVYVSVPS